MGFSEDSEGFSLRTPNGEVLDCEVSRFSISQDTALRYRQTKPASPSTSKPAFTHLCVCVHVIYSFVHVMGVAKCA